MNPQHWGRMAKGMRKKISPAESQRRRESLAKARLTRWPRKIDVDNTVETAKLQS